MHPVLLLLGGAAAGALALNMKKKADEKAKEDEAARQKVLSQAASEFKAGNAYSVQMMVTKDIGTNDVATASKVIGATMEQLGWKLLSTPVLRGDKAKEAFTKGEPSEWVFSGVWRRKDTKTMTVAPQWLGMAMAYNLPIAPDPSAII